MLVSNTMRFGTDESTFSKASLLRTKLPFDAATSSAVNGFEISGSQPDGTDRKILFKVDDALVKFTDAQPVTVSGSEDFDTVNRHGNSVDELLAVTDIPAWCGKKIYPLIALSAPAEATVLPSIKIALKVKSSGDSYEKTTELPTVELTDTEGALPRISSVDVSGATTGQGSFLVTGSFFDGEKWSDYVPVQNIRDVGAKRINLRVRYTVNTLGSSDSARVDKIILHSSDGTSEVSGSVAEIYSVMRDYSYPLKTCSLAVRHKRLIDSVIHAFVNFAETPKRRTFLDLGITDGASQVFTLGVDGKPDEGIDQSTLKIFVDGAIFTNFSYNTELSEVTLLLEPGKVVSASYEYNRQPENWREMTADVVQQPYDDGTFLTRFIYSLPDDQDDNRTVTNVRIQLERTHGTVTDEILGTATGFSQQFVLAHAAQAESLAVNADFTYDADTQILTCVAPAGTQIKASYDWLGETHSVYSWAAAWSI